MKVLFFSHQASFIYGGEVCTLALMERLKAVGTEVHFASPEGEYHSRAKETGAICHIVEASEFQRTLVGGLSFVSSFSKVKRSIRAILQEHQISLIHATSLKAFAYVSGQSLPVIWHHHDILPGTFLNRLWIRFFASKANRIIVPSNATGDALVAAGVEEAKIRTLYNGLQSSNWFVRSKRSDSYRYRLGFVGELSYRKGVDRLVSFLEALKRKDALDGIEVVVVGAAIREIEFAQSVRQDCKNFPISFLGRREDVAKILQSVDVLLVPSRQDPLPTVVVEAFWSGVPVVASPVGGLPEMIVHGKNGFLAGSPDDWAEAIFALRPQEAWTAFSKHARQTGEEKFSIEKSVNELLAIYGEVIA